MPQGIHKLRNDQVIRCQARDADHVDVFLQSERDHFFDLLPRRRIDNLHGGIAEIGGDHAATAIMPVKANLGYKYADRMLIHLRAFRLGDDVDVAGAAIGSIKNRAKASPTSLGVRLPFGSNQN